MNKFKIINNEKFPEPIGAYCNAVGEAIVLLQK